MNNQEIIRKLKEYRSLHAECDRLRRRISDKRGSIYDIRAVVTDCVHVKSGDIADRVERVVEMMESTVDYYTRKLEEAERSEQGIVELIGQISDSEERNVLFMHYIEGKNFMDIGDALYISERTVCSRHKSAIEKLCDSSLKKNRPEKGDKE